MQHKISQLHENILKGDFRALARGITIVENELEGSQDLLLNLKHNKKVKIVGITGPPGAGKSTLVNALLGYWLQQQKKIAVLAVDPSSPFNYGALLGDRIRMRDYYTNPNIYIRSLATRGSLGGLSARIIEITDLVKEADFDIILVETVGVGQSEVEIAGLAECTIVAMVPEAGDEVQTLKSGIMEIADIFVVNKADRPNADGLYNHLRIMAHEKANGKTETPVFKTIASENNGIGEVANAITDFLGHLRQHDEMHIHLLMEKSRQLIQQQLLRPINFKLLRQQLVIAQKEEDFNLYMFVARFMESIK